MRTSRLSRLAALVMLLAATAHAQGERGAGWRREGRHRERQSTRADSTRTLAGAWQAWGHAGIDWLGAPRDVKSRYAAGFGLGVNGDRRFADRLALRGRLGYHDLPSKRPGVIFVNGAPYAPSIDYGHGYMGSALGAAAVRAWNHLWLEGAAGAGYFHSGLRTDQTYVDPATGQSVRLVTGSGWGPAWGLGARYEFQPTPRDRLLAECQFLSTDRDGARLELWELRVGYRLF